MALYPSKSKDTQSQDIQHASLVIRNQQKERDPNINIVNGIHNIKGKTSVNILVSNYSDKHVTFNKGEYVGHLEPAIEHIDEEKSLHLQENSDAHTTSSVTTQTKH